jgi:hypothetical protein
VYGTVGLGIEGYLFKKLLDGGYPPSMIGSRIFLSKWKKNDVRISK